MQQRQHSEKDEHIIGSVNVPNEEANGSDAHAVTNTKKRKRQSEADFGISSDSRESPQPKTTSRNTREDNRQNQAHFQKEKQIAIQSEQTTTSFITNNQPNENSAKHLNTFHESHAKELKSSKKTQDLYPKIIINEPTAASRPTPMKNKEMETKKITAKPVQHETKNVKSRYPRRAFVGKNNRAGRSQSEMKSKRTSPLQAKKQKVQTFSNNTRSSSGKEQQQTQSNERGNKNTRRIRHRKGIFTQNKINAI